VIVLATAGIVMCLHLYSLHVALLMGEIKSGPLCGTDNEMGCHSVATSLYSSMMGLPLALWGAIFYSILVVLGVGGVVFWRDCGRAFLRWAFFLAAIAFAIDIYLAYVMVYRIGAVCWLCVATYGVTALILVILAKGVWREPKPRVSLRDIFPGTRDAQGSDLYYRNVIKGLLIGAMVLASLVGVTGSQFLARSLTENDRERLAKIKENLVQQKPVAIGTDNRPAMGADDPAVTIVEFSDFLCQFCDMAAKYLKLAKAGNEKTARFVFRHFPLDKSCNKRLSSNLHPGACLLAEGAACASEQDKFWEYHDIAFETKDKISRAVVLDIASKTGLDLRAFEGCLDSGRGLRVVTEDIQAALAAGVRSTPTLFINGRMLRGVQKPWVLNEIFQYSKKNFVLPKPPQPSSP
jgi:protein-disulfide isomerase/uncharacterized membrane protein